MDVRKGNYVKRYYIHYIAILAVAMLVTGFLSSTGCSRSKHKDEYQVPEPESAMSLDFTILGMGTAYTIQGTVFNDINGNGVQDIPEPGIVDVMVALEGIEDTFTDSMGMYSFNVMDARSYTVSITVPSDFIPITPFEVVVTVPESDATVDFGVQSEVENWSIFGYVFDDLNMDGVLDTGEPVIPDALMTLVGIGETVTGVDGSYAFAVADTGMYTVVETDPEGYLSTTPNEIVVQILDSDVQVDFGDRMVTEVPVDVKPGSEINPLNLQSKGVLPVAILGSEELDVNMIDPDSLLLNGVPPLRWSYGDVCSHEDESVAPEMKSDDIEIPDGYEDLTLKFSTQQIVTTIGEVERGDIITLIMSGTMMDGAPVSGEETVWIVQVPK